MFYTDISLIAIASILTIYYAAANILKRFRFGINRLFAVYCLVALALYVSLLALLLIGTSPFVTTAFRTLLSIGLLLVQVSFHLAQAYPRWERKLPSWFILLSFIPGLALVVVTLYTDFIVERIDGGETLSITYGTYAYTYLAAIVLYLLGFIIVMLYKARNLENISFKGQMYYLLVGYLFCVVIAAATLYVLPVYFEIVHFRRLGLVAAVVAFTIFMNYAIYGDRTLDLKKFYLSITAWSILFGCLVVPAYFIIDYSVVLSRSGNPIPVVGIALFLFLYLFLFYRFGKPALERLFRKSEIAFERNVNEFFQDMSDITNESDQVRFWDIFFERSIYPLETRFDISSASFMISNPKDRSFSYSFGFGEKINLGDIAGEGDIVKCLREYGNLVDTSYFFTDEKLAQYKSTVYEVLRKNGVAVSIPFFNLEKEMIGILFLGGLKSGKPYSLDLINALEVYRIQFELSLANALMLEGIKQTQVVEHDKLVLGSIKKKIIPKELGTVEGIRLSTFYADNSEFGGDYFDSVILGNERVGIFICDTANAGIESGLLSLEIYSVLHNQPEKFDTPDKMLNAMNWVISTSRFSEKYVQAFYMIYDKKTGELHYSSAAFNPCVYYDIGKDSFTELDTKGIPLGIDKNFIYEFHSMKMQSGGIGFLYSDGLKTAVNKEGGAFSPGRIRDIIRLNTADTPAVITRKIYTDFSSFSKTAELKNDVSLILFRTY